GRALKVDRLAVIAAAVTRAFELVLAGFPVGRAAKMGAARIDDEEPIRRLVHPDAILLLVLGIDAERVVAGKADLEGAGRLEDCPRQKEPHEHQKTGRQKREDRAPHDPPASLENARLRRGLDDRRRSLWRRLRR